MSRTSFVFVPALLGLVFLIQGCNQTCQEVCRSNANYVTGCLESWDAQWSDFGYDGLVMNQDTLVEEQLDGGAAAEYQQACNERYASSFSRGTPDAQTATRLACADDLEELAAAVGCNEYAPNGFELDPTAN